MHNIVIVSTHPTWSDLVIGPFKNDAEAQAFRNEVLEPNTPKERTNKVCLMWSADYATEYFTTKR